MVILPPGRVMVTVISVFSYIFLSFFKLPSIFVNLFFFMVIMVMRLKHEYPARQPIILHRYRDAGLGID